MTKEEIIARLKSGRVLMMDGAANEAERNLIYSLQEEGMINVELVEGDQYSAWRITWK